MHNCHAIQRTGRKLLGLTVLVFAIGQVPALAAAPIELPQKVSTRYKQFIVKSNSRSQISKLFIEQKGALNLKLEFDAIKLPDGAYVQIFDDAGTSLVLRSAQDLADGVLVNGENATIQVSTDGLRATSLRLKKVTYQPAPTPAKTRQILGADNRRDLECYANTPIYSHSLAAVIALGGASGSLIGNGRYLLTNAHATPELPANGEPAPLNRDVRLGWFNETCDAANALPRNRSISLRTTKQLARGTPSSATDYSLIELDQFDVEHSHALEVFGSLQISEKKAIDPGTSIYIPQYGNGGLRPMAVSAESDDGQNTKIFYIDPDNSQQKHNADTQPGSSGSPLIEQSSQQIVGLHWGAIWDGKQTTNRAVGLPVLQQKITPLLGVNNNLGVLGEGKFRGYNLDLVPYIQPLEEIKIPAGGRITSYPDISLEHLGRYSNARLELQNTASAEITPLLFRIAIQDESGIHDLSTPAGQDARLLLNSQDNQVVYSPQNLRGWLPLQINDEQGLRIQNLITSLGLNRYNPFQSPFDGVNTQQLYLNIPDARRAVTMRQLMKGQHYSYLATYSQQGPQTVASKPDGQYSEVLVPLREANGSVELVRLRGYRETLCSKRPMNANIGCQASLQSALILDYVPKDNANLPSGTYSGLLPLHAVAQSESHEILVNIKLVQP